MNQPSNKTTQESRKQDLFDRIKRESKFPTHAIPYPNSDMNLYVARIHWMNRIFELEVNEKPTNLGVVRLLKFYKTIIDEITELLDCINGEGFKDFILSNDPFLTSSDEPMYIENIVSQYEAQHGYTLEVNMVALADTLVDINVYDTSEAVRWGIPFDECCHAVMESQITKLDSDGKPLKSADGAKFIKGPYYEAPEPRIQQILDEHSK